MAGGYMINFSSSNNLLGPGSSDRRSADNHTAAIVGAFCRPSMSYQMHEVDDESI